MADKQAVVYALQTLPKDASPEETAEELCTMSAVRRGSADAFAGRTRTHQEAQDLPQSWATARSPSTVHYSISSILMGGWKLSRIPGVGPQRFTCPLVIRALIRLPDKILSPPWQMAKIKRTTVKAYRASGFAMVVARNILNFPDTVAMKAKHIIPHSPVLR
jgi:hypothetical protein